jgi:hypothetical protein
MKIIGNARTLLEGYLNAYPNGMAGGFYKTETLVSDFANFLDFSHLL